MEFRQWLMTEGDIHVTAFSSDGTVVINIRGKRYVYLTDSMYHDRWRRMARFRPGSVLNEIKKLVKEGKAQWLNAKS